MAASGCAPPHAAESGGNDQASFEGAAKVLIRAFGEGLVRPLQDSLGADVDPRAGRHLAVHGQAHGIQTTEFVPVAPARYQMRIRNKDTRRLFMGTEHADWLSGLDNQRLVILQALQRGDDTMIGLPISCGLSPTSVHDQLFRMLGNRRVQIVHQHAHGGFLMPAFAMQFRSVGGVNSVLLSLHGD